MAFAVIDFETRSAAELDACGVDAYAENPSTGIWCMGWAIDDEDVSVWRPDAEQTPYRLLEHIRSGRDVIAHNAYFDAVIWNDVICRRYEPHWPQIVPEQINCTMARANALQMPPSVEQCAFALGLPVQKDKDGRRLMLKYCRPKEITPDGEIIWHSNPDEIRRLEEYCKRDVEVERLIHKKLLALSATERKLWVIDFKINRRGMQFDMPTVSRMSRIVDAEVDAANEEMRAITEQAVPAVTNPQALAKFVRSHGIKCESVDKEHIEELLETDTLIAVVRRALELRQIAGKTSVAKLIEIPISANGDGRARGLYTYGGASCTLRWSGRRVQPQNLPRIVDFKQSEIEEIIAIVLAHPPHVAAELIRYAYGPPIDALSQCLRALIVPGPGNELIGSDSTQIEARVLPWLAGEDWEIEAYREFDAGRGPDVYRITYAKAFGLPVAAVTDNQRQTGKPMKLSLGYGGGFGAFKGMCKSYKIKVVEKSDDPNVLDRPRVEDIKYRFRDTHPATVGFWADLDECSRQAATDNTSRIYTTQNGAISFRRVGPYMFCRLPSGRCLAYVKPRLEWINKKWPDGETSRVHALVYYGQDAQTKRFGDQELYGGAVSAHVTQATARDIHAHNIIRLEDHGYPVVIHTHDEPIAEVRKGTADAKAYHQLMVTPEKWMAGLPIAASKPWIGQRYQKG